MSDTNNQKIVDATHSKSSRRRGLGRKLFWASLIGVGILAISRPLTALHHPFGSRGGA